MTKNASIHVEIPAGELIDKITILEIKASHIQDVAKLTNIQAELATLAQTRDQAMAPSSELAALTAKLKAVNESLWVIEDDIRDCERAKDFGSRFIELARAVYITNDERANLKREINLLMGSRLIEEKSYAPY